MDTVYLVQYSLIDDGGASPVAFISEEAAAEWIDQQREDPANISVGYEIIEAELRS